MRTEMDVITALRMVPRFKELIKKGKSRTQAEETEYQRMLASNPALDDIRSYERYAELMEMSGRTSVQDAELANFQTSPKYARIVAQYAKRKLGKGRSRRRKLTRRRRITRKRV